MKRLKPTVGIDVSEDLTLSDNSPDKVPSQQAVRSFSIRKVLKTTDPTSSDIEYDVPTIWLNTLHNIGYILTDITSGVATWKNFTTITGLTFKGVIEVNTDFPKIVDVEEGWLYVIVANVTDNAGPEYTNTGDSFISGTEISWDGYGWANLGTMAIWEEIDGVISPVNNNSSLVQIRYLSITSILKFLNGAGKGKILVCDENGNLSYSTAATNGQILIGKTNDNPVFAEITAGEGIDTSLGSGTLTISGEDATDSNKGIVELATTTESELGLDSNRVVTPQGLELSRAMHATGAYTNPTITSIGDGTITVSEGVYQLYKSIDGSGSVHRYTISGGTFTPTNNSISYLVADYNNGTPIMRLTSVDTELNGTTISPICSIYRINNDVDLLKWQSHAKARIEKGDTRMLRVEGMKRESGLLLTENATKLIKIYEGYVWFGVERIRLDEFLTGAENCILREWVYNGTSWNPSIVSSYDTAYYQGESGKVELDNNKYGVLWVYRKVASYDPIASNVAGYIFGIQSYNKLSDAQASSIPSTIPPIFYNFGIMVGRIIFQKDATSAIQINSAFDSIMTGGPPNHNDTLNIQGGVVTEYYHLTSTQHTELTNGGVTLLHNHVYIPVVIKTDSYLATLSDYLIICDKNSAMIISLPKATGSGKIFKIKNINIGIVSIDPDGFDTIDSELTQELNQWDCLEIVDSDTGIWSIT